MKYRRRAEPRTRAQPVELLSQLSSELALPNDAVAITALQVWHDVPERRGCAIGPGRSCWPGSPGA
jgi:hypothetical protein